MAMRITDGCTGCGACASLCENNAIVHQDDIYIIDESKCKECEGSSQSTTPCQDICPVGCVVRA